MRVWDRQRFYIFIGITVLALIIYGQFDPGQQPTGGDLSMWDYMAQSIVRGAVPYRDVVNIKTPLGAYISAAAIIAGKLVGVRDIIAIRYCYLLMAALTVSFTFLIADLYLKRRAIAAVAALAMLSFNSFAVWNASGSQVKTAAILFGLVSIYFVARQRPFWAGLAGALSFWCWQPGLLFVGVAGLVFCRFLTRPFDKRAFITAGGALLPLALGVALFAAVHAWQDFYRWNFEFNATNNSSVKSDEKLAKTADRLPIIIKKSYPTEWFWFLLWPVGTLITIFELARAFKRDGRQKFLDECWQLAPLLAVAVYGLFSLFNLQSGPDMIPFLPFVAIYAALAIGSAIELVPRARKQVYAAAIALVFILFVADAFTYRPAFTLQQEEREWSEVVAQLAPGDRVYAEGSLDLLVLYNLPNASKYIYFDRGKDIFAGKLEAGGFDAIIADLKRKQPKVVSFAKLNHVAEREKLLAWVEELYEPYKTIPSTNSGVFATTYPCNVYRIKTGTGLKAADAEEDD